MKAVLLAVLVAVGLGFFGSARADSGEREARTLFKEANRLLEQGDYVGALDMYRAAYGRFPSVKILLNIGTVLRQLGRDAEAADTYDKYLQDSAADPKRKPEVQKILSELGGRLGKIRIDVDEPGARVLVDGKPVGSSPTALTLRLNPGTHSVVAEKTGYALSAATISLSAGEERVVELRLTRANNATPLKPVAPTPISPVPPSPTSPSSPTESDTSMSDSRSVELHGQADHPWHHHRLGGILRGDFDASSLGRGAALAVGVSYGILDQLEVELTGLVGSTPGVRPGGRLLLLSGEWRPVVLLAIPIFFQDGAWPGIHAGAGIEWDQSPHLGFFIQAGVDYYPSTPMSYEQTLFVPSAGVQGRL